MDHCHIHFMDVPELYVGLLERHPHQNKFTLQGRSEHVQMFNSDVLKVVNNHTLLTI